MSVLPVNHTGYPNPCHCLTVASGHREFVNLHRSPVWDGYGWVRVDTWRGRCGGTKNKKHAYISVFFESGSVVVMLGIEGDAGIV